MQIDGFGKIATKSSIQFEMMFKKDSMCLSSWIIKTTKTRKHYKAERFTEKMSGTLERLGSIRRSLRHPKKLLLAPKQAKDVCTSTSMPDKVEQVGIKAKRSKHIYFRLSVADATLSINDSYRYQCIWEIWIRFIRILSHWSIDSKKILLMFILHLGQLFFG